MLKLLISASLLTSFVVLPGQAYAQRENTQQKGRPIASGPRSNTAREAKLQELRSANTAKRCELIQKRAGESFSRYQGVQQGRLTRYTELLGKLNETVARLNQAKINTSQLESVINQFKVLVEQYTELHTKAKTVLESYKNPSCEQISNTEYRSRLNSVQDQIKQLNTKAKEIQDFLSIQLKEVLQTLKRERVTSRPVR